MNDVFVCPDLINSGGENKMPHASCFIADFTPTFINWRLFKERLNVVVDTECSGLLCGMFNTHTFQKDTY